MKPNNADPKLTAYALGELDPGEQAAVEQQLEADPDARGYVEETASIARLLSEELSRQRGPGLLETQRQAIEHRLGPALRHLPHPRADAWRRSIVWGWMPLAVAASLLVVIGLVSLYRPQSAPPMVAKTNATNPSGGQAIIPVAMAPIPAGIDGPVGVATTEDGPFVNVADQPQSSFALNTPTVSYTYVNSAIRAGQRPDPQGVRIEQLVNAFTYRYPAPAADETFGISIEIGDCPWKPENRLARIGIRARGDVDPKAIIAHDAAVRVRFNPQQAAAYRLIGYEVPGAVGGEFEIRANHAVTALYEIIPARLAAAEAPGRELLSVTLGFRETPQAARREMLASANDPGSQHLAASDDFRFAAAVASFGMILRDSPRRGSATLASVAELADAARGPDELGQRRQFVALVRQTQMILQ